jgi:hypothetical protein
MYKLSSKKSRKRLVKAYRLISAVEAVEMESNEFDSKMAMIWVRAARTDLERIGISNF